MTLSYPSYEDIQAIREQLFKASMDHWIHHDFLSWKWWLLVGLTVIPWILWWNLVDRRRRQPIFLFGCLMSMFAVILDNLGTDLLWWGYPDKFLPAIPPLMSADLTLIPVCYMVIYQLFPGFKSFLTATVLLGAVLAYIAEPLIFIKLDLYRLNSWKLTYSLLFYVIAALVARFLVRTMKSEEPSA